jgi:uncharacterized protein (DUF433 family)
MNLSQWVSQDPEVMSGEVVFAGTRVPVAVLFENLEGGLSLDEILEEYPTIPKDGALAVLEESMKEVISSAPKAHL